MKELDNMKIIAVDHGYGNVKTANTVTPSGVTAFDSEPVFSGNVLEYNGAFYRVGEVHKEFMADKVSDDDYYILTLAAVAKELAVTGIFDAEIWLAAGLPMTWIRRQREAFRAYLLQNETADFRFNGEEYHIRFAGCSVFPQGYPAVVDYLRDFKGTNLLADIGNGTMNLLYIQDGRPVESRSWTEKLGVNQCVIAAENAVLNNLGVKIDEATVERVLRFGEADIAESYREIIISAARSYVSDIFAALRKYEYNPDVMRLYIVGGGGCLVRNFGEYDEERVTIFDDVRAAARGYEYLAYMNLTRN